MRVAAASIALVLVLALVGCGQGTSDDDATSAPQAATDTTFPDFVATTADGGQLDFGSLEGQDTVLWFWAPW